MLRAIPAGVGVGLKCDQLRKSLGVKGSARIAGSKCKTQVRISQSDSCDRSAIAVDLPPERFGHANNPVDSDLVGAKRFGPSKAPVLSERHGEPAGGEGVKRLRIVTTWVLCVTMVAKGHFWPSVLLSRSSRAWRLYGTTIHSLRSPQAGRCVRCRRVTGLYLGLGVIN